MLKKLPILLALAAIVALPLVFQRHDPAAQVLPGEPVLVVITPMNEAIRHEFSVAFARWHAAHYGQPAKIDWRVVGGTTEIMRYLESQYVQTFRAWWLAQGHLWLEAGGEALLDRRFDPRQPPPGLATHAAALRAWEQQRACILAFRQTDDPAAFTSTIDLFFGGGTYDHGKAAAESLIVPAWPTNQPPPDTLWAADGRELIPAALGGEVWRTDAFYGVALSTFGICYNTDRLRDLGIATPPQHWADLAAPAYVGQLGVADPTKSGSIAKAFEMIVQEQCWHAVRAAGYTPDDVQRFETAIAAAKLAPGVMPPAVPAAYQAAMEAGWLQGVRLLQAIGANARYFTDSATKVPIDVSMGDAAAGLAIDFYGRCQAEASVAPDGHQPMVYITPLGGSSVSADPVSLLRGAPHRELARRFLAFALGVDGQRLWNFKPGTPGGPERYALRRLPIRRDFYPGDTTNADSLYARQRACYTDALGSPDVNPYALGAAFEYVPRWTSAHFGVLRDLIRAMCMDSGDELRGAWKAILRGGGPARQADALALLQRLPDRPEPFTWASALRIPREHDRIDYLREWTVFFRGSYAQASARADTSKDPSIER